MNKNADCSRLNCMHRYQCPKWSGEMEPGVPVWERKGCTHEGRVGDCEQYKKMEKARLLKAGTVKK